MTLLWGQGWLRLSLRLVLPVVESLMLDAFIIQELKRREQERQRQERQRPQLEIPRQDESDRDADERKSEREPLPSTVVHIDI